MRTILGTINFSYIGCLQLGPIMFNKTLNLIIVYEFSCRAFHILPLRSYMSIICVTAHMGQEWCRYDWTKSIYYPLIEKIENQHAKL